MHNNIINKVCTYDQMKHLIDLGINVNNASFILVKNENDYEVKLNNGKLTNVIPTFSFEDILNILPDTIQVNKNGKLRDAFLICNKAFGTISYNDESNNWSISDMYICFSYDDYAVTAAYEMLCWIIENKYIEL